MLNGSLAFSDSREVGACDLIGSSWRSDRRVRAYGEISLTR